MGFSPCGRIPCPRRSLLILRRSSLRRRFIAHTSNRVAGQHQLHPPILLPPLGRIVRRNRLTLAKAVRFNRTGRNPLLHKIIPHGLSPMLRQILIVLVAAHTVSVSLNRNMQAGIRQHNPRNLRQPFPRSRKQLKTSAAEQNVRHIRDQTPRRVARGQNRVQLLQQPRPQFLLFFFRLLPQTFGLRRRSVGLLRFGGKNLLLGHRFGLGLLGFFFHALSFRLGLLRRCPRLFRLSLRRFRIRATFSFSVRIRAGFRFARRSGGLGLVFGLLFHRHQPRFFRRLGGFLGCGFHRRFVLFLPINFFRVHQLLPRLRQY